MIIGQQPIQCICKVAKEPQQYQMYHATDHLWSLQQYRFNFCIQKPTEVEMRYMTKLQPVLGVVVMLHKLYYVLTEIRSQLLIDW